MKLVALLALTISSPAFADTGSQVSPDQVLGEWINDGDCAREKTGVVINGPHQGETFTCLQTWKLNKDGRCTDDVEQLYCHAVDDGE